MICRLDPVKADALESVPEDGVDAFGCVTLPPPSAPETVSDLAGLGFLVYVEESDGSDDLPVEGDGPSVEVGVVHVADDVSSDELSGAFQGGAGCEADVPVHQGIGTVVAEGVLYVGFREAAEGEPLGLDPAGPQALHTGDMDVGVFDGRRRFI